MSSAFPDVQNHHPLDSTNVRRSQRFRPTAVQIRCPDRRQSVPLLDVAKSVVNLQIPSESLTPKMAGEISPTSQSLSNIAPVDTATSLMTLSKSQTALVPKRSQSLDAGEMLRDLSVESETESASSISSASEMALPEESQISSDGEKKRRRKRSPRAQRERRENKRTVYLQMLPPYCTDQNIVDLLSVFGQLQNIDWVGDARNACFVRFESQIQAKKAVQFGGSLPGKVFITSKKEQMEFIRSELGRLQTQQSALLEQLVPKRKLSLPAEQLQQQYNLSHRRVSTSPKDSSTNMIPKSHRRTRSETVSGLLACESSTNWRQNIISPNAQHTRNQSFPKFGSDDVRKQRSMSEISPTSRSSGPPRLNLKKPRRSIQNIRVAKGPDGSRGFARANV